MMNICVSSSRRSCLMESRNHNTNWPQFPVYYLHSLSDSLRDQFVANSITKVENYAPLLSTYLLTIFVNDTKYTVTIDWKRYIGFNRFFFNYVTLYGFPQPGLLRIENISVNAGFPFKHFNAHIYWIFLKIKPRAHRIFYVIIFTTTYFGPFFSFSWRKGL